MPRPKKEQPNRADGRFEIKITIGKTLDGKLLRKSFYSEISKADAQKQADEWKIQRAVSDQIGMPFVKKEITFGDWAMEWAETYKKPNVTENTYLYTYISPLKTHIIPYFGKALLTDIRPVDIQKFYAASTHLADSYLNKFDMILNALFDAAIDNDLCTKNPAKHISYTSSAVKTQKQVYSDEQIELVEKYARDRMPEVIVLLETGLRRGELVGLMWPDIDFEQETISVKRSVIAKKGGGAETAPPKKDSYRTNPLSQRALEALRQIPKTCDLIFPNSDGGVQHPNAWSKKLERFMKSLAAEHPDIPILTPHELRHTCGTRLRRQGVDIYTIQKFMGHKDINVTAGTYVHNELEPLREALKGGFKRLSSDDTLTT